MQFTMAFCLLLLSVNFLTCIEDNDCVIPLSFTHFVYIIFCFSVSWGILFFLQFLPWFGFIVIALQRMIQNLLSFAIIFLSILTPFVFAFKKFLGHTGSICNYEFFHIINAFYSTFKVMLNMVDFEKYSGTDMSAVSFLHFVYVFLVPVLLINFLIALFSTSYAQVYANKRIYHFIQQLSVSMIIEYRLNKIIPSWYTWQRKRCFLTTDDGRILLRRVILRDRCALNQKKDR